MWRQGNAGISIFHMMGRQEWMDGSTRKGTTALYMSGWIMDARMWKLDT